MSTENPKILEINISKHSFDLIFNIQRTKSNIMLTKEIKEQIDVDDIKFDLIKFKLYSGEASMLTEFVGAKIIHGNIFVLKNGKVMGTSKYPPNVPE